MFRIAQSIDDLFKVAVVRGIVFVEEQGTSYAIERDEHDPTAIHILGEIDGEPVAAGRIRGVGEYAKLERIAIRKKWRGLGHGSALIEYMVQTARQRGVTKFKLHAQVVAKGFYERHGFHVVGEPFVEADIDHCLMVREEV
jgi:predicted GNAT family N-acyltransferase